MGPGNYSVSLKADTPQSILDQIVLVGSSVAIGPRLDIAGMADADILAALKAAGGYRGVVLARPDPFTIEGQDLSWWLTEFITDTAISKAGSHTTTQWAGYLLPINGISVGTVTNGDALVDFIAKPGTTIYSAVQALCDESNVEYQVRPDGTIDFAPSTTMFPAPSSTAATIITRDPSGDEGGLSGVEAIDINRSRDATNVYSRAMVLHSKSAKKVKFAFSSQTPTGVTWKDDDGSTPSPRTLAVEALNLKAARAAEVAANVIPRMAQDQREVTLSSRTHNVTAEVTPGERVLVYDVQSGLYDSAGTQYVWRGEVITPITLRVHALTWPITGDLGVFLRVSDGATWVDLTPYVVTEDPTVSWVVSVAGRKVNRSPISNGMVTIALPGSSSEGRAALGRMTSDTDTSDDFGTWTPSWSNITIGTGGLAANEGQWSVANGEMRIRTRWILGTGGGFAVSGNPTLTMPDGWQLRTDGTSAGDWYGIARLSANGLNYQGVVVRGSDTTLIVTALRSDVTYVRQATVSATVPDTWTSGDGLLMSLAVPVEPA